MKWLKSFNEAKSVDDLVDEVDDFTQSYLAYLIDEGFSADVWLVKGNNYQSIVINIMKKEGERKWLSFNWVDIKDLFIPYLTFLNRKYDLEVQNEPDEVLGFCYDHFGWHYYRIDDAINDNLNLEDDTLEGIELRIKI